MTAIENGGDSGWVLPLLERARHGDRRAQGELLEAYDQPLKALLHLKLAKPVRDAYGVEDALQEVKRRALKSLKDFQWRGPGCFFRWLGGIAEHVALDAASRAQRLPKQWREPHTNGSAPTGMDGVVNPRADSPSRIAEQEDRFRRLEEAFDRLSQDHQEVIYLSRFRKLPMKEIGERMGRSAEAAAMLHLRALQQLAKQLGGALSSFSLPAHRTLIPRHLREILTENRSQPETGRSDNG